MIYTYNTVVGDFDVGSDERTRALCVFAFPDENIIVAQPLIIIISWFAVGTPRRNDTSFRRRLVVL